MISFALKRIRKNEAAVVILFNQEHSVKYSVAISGWQDNEENREEVFRNCVLIEYGIPLKDDQ